MLQTLRRHELDAGLRPDEPHGGQPVQPDQLDQRADVRLRPAEPQGPALGPQALCQAGEVDHHRRVGEPQVGEIDDHVARRLQGSRERTAAPADRRPIFVPRDPQDRQLLVELNDSGKLVHTAGFVKAADATSVGGR